MAQVSLKNVSKTFPPNIKAVENVNMGIENKEFIVLVGPSGCGKSTTLRMVAGLENPSSGDIYIGKNHVNELPAKDRDIAMVFQNYALYPHMNVYGNMAFALKLKHFPKAEIEKRITEAANILGIHHLLKRKPKEISGGERQRVALGRAIVRKPAVFLFDEPLSNLDAKLRVQMRTELNKLHVRLQTTMIYVTHDQVEAMTLGTRIAVMKDGQIQQFDEPIKVYDDPVNKFVASFIGSPPMNFLEGKLIKKEGKFYFDEGDFQVKVQENMYPKLQDYLNKEIIFGIRPENIYDKLFASAASPDNTIRVKCEVVEPMGAETHVNLSTTKNDLTAVLDGHNKPQRGEYLEMVFDMKRVHFFDKTTEKIVV